MPSVQAYMQTLHDIAAQRAVDKQEREHKAFLERLARR